jgi:hypothetical protein
MVENFFISKNMLEKLIIYFFTEKKNIIPTVKHELNR